MASRQLLNAEAVVSRLLGTTPRMIPVDPAGNTKVAPLYRSPPFEGRLPGFKEHVLVAHVGGCSPSSVRTDGKLYTAPVIPDTVSICPGDRETVRRSTGAIEVVNVYLDPARLQSCSDQVGSGGGPELIDRLGATDPTLFAIMKLLGEEAASSQPMALMFVDQLIDLLCLHLLRAHTSFPVVAAAAMPRRGLAPWQVKRVTGYMREHLDEDIRLQHLADLVGLSRFHFCSAFRKATGRTPYEWLTRLRIETARKLLADPAIRIIDIALAVGYQTPSAFAAGFRKHVGVSPSEIRRRL